MLYSFAGMPVSVGKISVLSREGHVEKVEYIGGTIGNRINRIIIVNL